ncbi:hypothetical protein J1N35_018704, partial [Gossypium stocksii]
AEARVGGSSTVAASSCLLLNALFATSNLQVQIKHEGEPETLAYRGFFVDTT